MLRGLPKLFIVSAFLVLTTCAQDQEMMPKSDAFAKLGESIEKSGRPGKEIKTTELGLSREDVTTYVENAVAKRPIKTFAKWSPKKGENIYYAVTGLELEQRLVFATIVSEFAARTRLPVRPHEKNSRINILFNYLKDMSEIREVPDLRKIYCRPPGNICPNPKSPAIRAKVHGKSGWSNGETAFLSYALATKLDPSASGNELAAIFVRDVLHAFIGDTFMSDVSQESVISLQARPIVASGPIYSWRVPAIDLLFLSAVYDPSMPTGISLPEAADLIAERMAHSLETPKKLVPESTLTLGKHQ